MGVDGSSSRRDGGSGGEWRNDLRGPMNGPSDYHHGRSGGGGHVNDRGRDNGRGNATAGGGPNNNINRLRGSGNTWPRDMDGNTRR
jgi:hypothetical protein